LTSEKILKSRDFSKPAIFRLPAGHFSAIRQRLAVASGTLPDRSRGGPTDSA
jgi:hypothetical protein